MSKKRSFQAVVAHPVSEERQRICRALEKTGVFHISYTTHDGLDCLREAVSARPDLMVLDTVLSNLDGLEVLRRLKEFPSGETKYLMLTSYNGYLTEQARLAGADYCLLEPCSEEVLAARALELLMPPRTMIYHDRDIDRETAQILAQYEAPAHLKGYDYTLDCVRILVRDPGLIRRRRITEELYAVVGAAYGSEYKRVERALRTFTDHILTRCALSTLESDFNSAAIQRGHISNTVFLSSIAQRVSTRLQSQTTTTAHD